MMQWWVKKRAKSILSTTLISARTKEGAWKPHISLPGHRRGRRREVTQKNTTKGSNCPNLQ